MQKTGCTIQNARKFKYRHKSQQILSTRVARRANCAESPIEAKKTRAFSSPLTRIEFMNFLARTPSPPPNTFRLASLMIDRSIDWFRKRFVIVVVVVVAAIDHCLNINMQRQCHIKINKNNVSLSLSLSLAS